MWWGWDVSGGGDGSGGGGHDVAMGWVLRRWRTANRRRPRVFRRQSRRNAPASPASANQRKN